MHPSLITLTAGQLNLCKLTCLIWYACRMGSGIVLENQIDNLKLTSFTSDKDKIRLVAKGGLVIKNLIRGLKKVG